MKRLSVHAVFAVLAAVAAAAAGVQALRLQQAERLNHAILTASQRPLAAAAAGALGASAAAGSASAAVESGVPPDAPAAVRLASATALAQAGAFDAAFKAYSGLIEPGRLDAVGRHALYNLGNMVLRQGLGLGAHGRGDTTPTPSRSEGGPLIELAKQRYRDLLRADPSDWDARYNLERALRAAPEEEALATEPPTGPVERRNMTLRGMTPGDLP